MSEKSSFETKLIHAGELKPRVMGAVNVPIFQSSTYEYGGAANYHDIKYIRLNNTPNHLVLHQKLAALESAEDALVTASGMSAITTSLMTVLKAGDHILVQDCLYGGTHDFITKDFENLGLTHDFIDANAPATWQSKLKRSTKAVYVETIANPLLSIPDFESVVSFARGNNLVSIIDNTFASPYNFRPIEHGFDLCLHSCTKYLNGHSDIVAGACMGSAQLITQIRHKLNHLGGTLDPHAAYLLYRGMKTLALRVERQNANALAIARFLESHAAVSAVYYPGLPAHRQHERATKFFTGYGGMLSFELKASDSSAADALLNGVELPLSAASLGGVETLITRPATTSHLGMSQPDRLERGITDGLIRLSVGIEGEQDLIADLKQALEQSVVSSRRLQ